MLDLYTSFFLASAGASAALVGLLFVSLSIDAELEKESRIRQFMLTETAFISLGGIFLISLLALLPDGTALSTAGGIMLSIIGIWSLVRRTHRVADQLTFGAQDSWYLFVTVGVYFIFAATSLWIYATGGTIALWNAFCILIAVLSGISLVRAWRALLISKRHSAKR
jgi:hypothetical protein